MTRLPVLLLIALPGAALAQSAQPGNWDITSTAVDLTIPGAPGFLLRMMKGRSRTEHKCLPPGEAPAGVAALFIPDPKANCRVDHSRIAGGRIDHLMFCPQKKGEPIRVARVGSYTATSFTARMIMSGQTPKGPMRVIADQRARPTAPTCRK